jgi:hypothetical protein
MELTAAYQKLLAAQEIMTCFLNILTPQCTIQQIRLIIRLLIRDKVKNLRIEEFGDGSIKTKKNIIHVINQDKDVGMVQDMVLEMAKERDHGKAQETVQETGLGMAQEMVQDMVQETVQDMVPEMVLEMNIEMDLEMDPEIDLGMVQETDLGKVQETVQDMAQGIDVGMVQETVQDMVQGIDVGMAREKISQMILVKITGKIKLITIIRKISIGIIRHSLDLTKLKNLPMKQINGGTKRTGKRKTGKKISLPGGVAIRKKTTALTLPISLLVGDPIIALFSVKLDILS